MLEELEELCNQAFACSCIKYLDEKNPELYEFALEVFFRTNEMLMELDKGETNG